MQQTPQNQTIQKTQTNPAQKAPEANSGPWWGYGHMWMVVAGPAIVVVAGFITLWLAIKTPDPVYTDKKLQAGHAELAPAVQARNHAATGVKAVAKEEIQNKK